MKPVNVRQIVFGLMVVAVAVSAFVYAGSSAPWAGSAYALVIPSASTPAPPTVTVGWATPTQLNLVWYPGVTGATPDHFYVTTDGVPSGIWPATAGSTEILVTPLVPGSTHTYQVFVAYTGTYSTFWSDPGQLIYKQPSIFQITPSAGTGGSISPSSIQDVGQGQESPTFVITPDVGYRVDQIKDGTTMLNGTLMPDGTVQYRFVNVQAAHSIAATFVSAPVLPKVTLALGRPSVPRSGRTKKAVRVAGSVSSAVPYSTASSVKLKFYRLQKRGRKSVWVLRKTTTAARPDTNSYSASLKLKPTGTWSVVAESIGDDTHTAANSARSKSFKMK
jgi:hypothetical protein